MWKAGQGSEGAKEMITDPFGNGPQLPTHPSLPSDLTFHQSFLLIMSTLRVVLHVSAREARLCDHFQPKATQA